MHRILIPTLLLVTLLNGCQSAPSQASGMPDAPTALSADSLGFVESDSLYRHYLLHETALQPQVTDTDFVVLSDVVPDIIQEIRYHSTYNFVGRRLPGYQEPIALLSRRAADSLKVVSDELVARGYRLKVFDAYRPTRAVHYLIGWARALDDTLMKRHFYPDVPKQELFHLGYLAHRSGHSRGSTVDVSLFSMQTQREVDMGGTYDFLGSISHYYHTEGLNPEQIQMRRLLHDCMVRHGFKGVGCEWWHFTLRDEPYPDTYFDFPVSRQSVSHDQ